MNDLPKALCVWLCALCLLNTPHFAIHVHAQTTNSVPRVVKISARSGDVILLRGFADVFSRGLDEIGRKLEARGIDVTVTNHQQWKRIANKVIENRRRFGRRPVILIGHSLGANAVIRLAKRLNAKRIRVDYMATFAATNPDPVPANVRKVTNYFFKTDGWGEPLIRSPGFRGIIRNIDFSKEETIGHFNIDEQPRLQREVIGNILRYVAPTKRRKKVVKAG